MINERNQDENGSQSRANAGEDSESSVESGLQHVAAAAIAEDWMEKVQTRKDERCVSANELTSLSALILYVAHTLGGNEFRIERDLADRFNVANVKCLPATRFDDAIRYLVDRVG